MEHTHKNIIKPTSDTKSYVCMSGNALSKHFVQSYCGISKNMGKIMPFITHRCVSVFACIFLAFALVMVMRAHRIDLTGVWTWKFYRTSRCLSAERDSSVGLYQILLTVRKGGRYGFK